MWLRPFGARRKLALIAWVSLALASAMPLTAQAQVTPTVPDRQLPRPSDQRLPEPEFTQPEIPGIELPPIPPPSPDEGLSSTVKVFIRTIELSGNTVFSDEQLASITFRYEGREVSNAELQQLRRELTLHYVNNHYINSGAIIPDQQVADGVVEIRIVEGVLSEVEIGGVKRLRPAYVSKRLQRGAGPPLNVAELQDQLQLLLQNPLIERINADLAPGDRPGESRLKAVVTEANPFELDLTVDNNVSPSVGELHGALGVGLRNLTGWGDTLNATAGVTDGLGDYSASYAVPVNAHDTTLSLSYQHSESDVVEEPFDALDIESESESYGFGVSHPFHQTPKGRFSMGLALDVRGSQTFLGGGPFPFSRDSGVGDDGKSDVSVIRFNQDWLKRNPTQVIAVRSTLSVGIDAFGATINDSALPDGRFTTWLGQFQWARRIGDRGQLLIRTDGQFAFDRLLPLEQFAVGGANSVRGYRKNQLVRDHGFATSLEYRFSILSSAAGRSVLQLAPFADVGGAWSKHRTTPNPELLGSAGVGLLWDPHPRIHAEVYWGFPFEDVKNPDDSLQEEGLHFAFTATIF